MVSRQQIVGDGFDPSIPHDIFLSHSGAQKGFAQDLYEELSKSLYTTFFDIKYHSLPLGENFPKRIKHAARTCQLAVVVLSEEFVCSKWPMVELTTFVDAGVKILPLFYRLSPDDLKLEGNCKRWEKQWEEHAENDKKQRINISKWADALSTLRSQNGVKFDANYGGEKTYLDKIMQGIHETLPPAVKFNMCQIRGKERLCKVILDKLKEMTEKTTVSHIGIQPKVSVLGLYGLGGSGKSSLCKCLYNHFLPRYGPRKTLYLEMPSHPSHADVVNKLKELLKLTDFRDKMNLDKVSELEEVEDLLKTFKFQECRVFLVVDNISEQSLRLVEKILVLGVGQGSKLILVARSLDILHPILNQLRRGSQCTCDSIAIPSINETEAIEILLQTARASYIALDKDACFENLTSQESHILHGIVHMCSFHGNQCLPLVMNAIGAMLLKYEGDFESWGSHLESFWEKVKTCKEDIVVENLVGESFKGLNEQLQLLFLDVALFIFRLQSQELQKMDEVIAFLCLMHGCTSTRIQMWIKDLQRNCFLIVSEENIISVHDVYLEFAKSIQNDISKFMNSSARWCWEAYDESNMGPEVDRVVVLKEGSEATPDQLRLRTSILQLGEGLRTLIFQVGKGCERVDLQGFKHLKAVVLRNCMSLKVLRLAGLSSLAYLSCENCGSLQKIECNDISLHNVKRLRMENAIVPINKQYPSTGLELGIAWQMRNLQVVHLQNTGIKGLENVGSYWPQLQDLSVIEACLEAFHLGNLPCLKRFRFSDRLTSNDNPAWPFSDGMHDQDQYRVSTSWEDRKGQGRTLTLPGKDLLAGCTQLKEVAIESGFYEVEGELEILSSNLEVLRLHRFFTGTELPDLSSLEPTLKWLELWWCEQLKRVDFDAEFKNLRKLTLHGCKSLEEVSGLEFLPNLQVLHVVYCQKLQTLRGIHKLNMLERFVVCTCQQLQEISCLSGMMSLTELQLLECNSNLGNTSCADLQNLVKLKQLACDLGSRDSCLSVRNLENLEALLYVSRESGIPDISSTRGILEGLEDAVNLRIFKWMCFHQADHETLMRGANNVMKLDRFIPSIGCLRSIQEFTIVNVCEVGSMDGIEHLLTLKKVSLKGLKNLRSVRGLESLGGLRKVYLRGCLVLEELPCLFNTTHLKIENCSNLKVVLAGSSCEYGCTASVSTIRLQWLQLITCPMLEELPSLQALVNMQSLEIIDCPKLKAVEGCDGMKCLDLADFDGCKSLACLPFNSLSMPPQLAFRGCKFAGTAEELIACACAKRTPTSVRAAALDALLWEYYQKDASKERVVEGLFSCILSLLDDKWMDLEGLGEALERFWISLCRMPFPAAIAVRNLEVELRLRGKLTKRGLMRDSHQHRQSLCRFLDDIHVATLITANKWFHLRVFNGQGSVLKTSL